MFSASQIGKDCEDDPADHIKAAFSRTNNTLLEYNVKKQQEVISHKANQNRIKRREDDLGKEHERWEKDFDARDQAVAKLKKELENEKETRLQELKTNLNEMEKELVEENQRHQTAGDKLVREYRFKMSADFDAEVSIMISDFSPQVSSDCSFEPLQCASITSSNPKPTTIPDSVHEAVQELEGRDPYEPPSSDGGLDDNSDAEYQEEPKKPSRKHPRPYHTELRSAASKWGTIRKKPRRSARAKTTSSTDFQDIRGKHRIVECPQGSREFYVLSCKTHNLDFNLPNPLKEAKKHLSVIHGISVRYGKTLVEVGSLVNKCNSYLAKESNDQLSQMLRGTGPDTPSSDNHSGSLQNKWVTVGDANEGAVDDDNDDDGDEDEDGDDDGDGNGNGDGLGLEISAKGVQNIQPSVVHAAAPALGPENSRHDANPQQPAFATSRLGLNPVYSSMETK